MWYNEKKLRAGFSKNSVYLIWGNMCVTVHVRGQRTTGRSSFPPSTMWVQRNTGLQSWQQTPAEPSH